MDLGEGDKLGHVGGDPLVFEQIIIKGANGTKFSFNRQFMIYIYFVRYRRIIFILQVVGQIFGVGDDIGSVEFFQVLVRHKA